MPTINKETLARKLTIDLHRKAKKGAPDANYSEKQVEEMMDDMLTCALLDFLGNGTKLYQNKFNDKDANNGKFCTMPVKMLFKAIVGTLVDELRYSFGVRVSSKLRLSGNLAAPQQDTVRT